MDGGYFRHILDRLRGDMDGGRGASDGQLLERFAHGGDPAAFESLVRRHGPLVLGACRRVLPNAQDAEDVCQAAFLILARKAASLDRQRSVAGWLYTVAHRLAVRLRDRERSRRARELAAPATAPPDPLAEVSGRELLSLLDAELHRLPEKFRAPLVLCYLEGKSREEAAQALGWTEGQVKGRLERGREALRRRLARRGLALSAALLGGLVAGEATAAFPPGLTLATVRAAVAFVTGGKVPAPVLTLARGGLRSMFVAKIKSASVLLLAVTAVAASVAASTGALRHAFPADAPPAAEAHRGLQAEPARVDAFGDPLPPGALARLGTARFRNGALILDLAYSPDGKVLAAAGTGKVVLWDAASGKKLRHLAPPIPPDNPGPIHSVRSVAFSADGKTLAGGYSAPVPGVILWDVATGKLRRRIETRTDVYSVALSRDGKHVAAAQLIPTSGLTVWEAESGKVVRTFEGVDAACSVAFTPDGKALACRCPNGAVILFDVGTGNKLFEEPGDNKRFTAGPLALTADGGLIAAADGDRVTLWDPKAGKAVRRIGALKAPDNPVAIHPADGYLRAAFSPDGKVLATAGFDGVTRTWSVATGKPLRTFPADGTPMTALAFSPDGKRLATTAMNGTVIRWDLATGKEDYPFTGHHTRPRLLAFSPDGKVLASAGWLRGKTEVIFWDVAARKELRSLDGVDAAGSPRALAYSPNGKLLACAIDKEEALVVWDTATGKVAARVKTGLPTPTGLAFAPDGKAVVCVGVRPAAAAPFFAAEAALWDVATGKKLRELPGQDFGGAAAFSPDGKALAVSNRKAVRLWKTATWKMTKEFAVEESHFQFPSVWFADDRTLAWTSVAQPLRFLDVVTGEQAAAWPMRTGLPCVGFTPGGKTVLWTDSRSLFITERATRRELRHIPVAGGIQALACSPDGKLAATAAIDGSVLLWDAIGNLPDARLSDEEREAAWAELSDVSSERTAAAAASLICDRGAVGFLKGRLLPYPAATRGQMAHWVADLDADDFEVREGASAELARQGAAALPVLRKVLSGEGTLEARRRARALLDLFKTTPPDQLRAVRAVEVLEAAASAEARGVLEGLAERGRSERAVAEARAALERLKARAHQP